MFVSQVDVNTWPSINQCFKFSTCTCVKVLGPRRKRMNQLIFKVIISNRKHIASRANQSTTLRLQNIRLRFSVVFTCEIINQKKLIKCRDLSLNRGRCQQRPRSLPDPDKLSGSGKLQGRCLGLARFASMWTNFKNSTNWNVLKKKFTDWLVHLYARQMPRF